MGLNTPKKNRDDETAADQRLIEGYTKHAAIIPSVVLDGASATTKDIIATLQSRVDKARASESARATWLAAVQAERAERDETRRFVSGLKQAALLAFGGRLDALADFGLTPRKPRVDTPDQKLAAIAKGKATRAARHTMGSRQRAAIKGTVAPKVTAAEP
jgi:hypothetical protein